MSSSFTFPPPPPPPPTASNATTRGQSSSERGGGGRGNYNPRSRGPGGPPRGGRGGRGFRPPMQQSNQMRDHSFGGSRQTHGQYAATQGRGGSQFQQAPSSHNQSKTTFGQEHGHAQYDSLGLMGSGPTQTGNDWNRGIATQEGRWNPNKRKRGSEQANHHPSHGQSSRAGKPAADRARNPSMNSAPSIPSFGAPLPGTSGLSLSGAPAGHSQRGRQSKRHRGIHLGLAPKDYESSSEDEDVDEEEVYAQSQATALCTFEHNGETYSLSTPAEIASWIKERRKLFPTGARIKEKEQEEEQEQVANERVRQAAREADQKHKTPNQKRDRKAPPQKKGPSITVTANDPALQGKSNRRHDMEGVIASNPVQGSPPAVTVDQAPLSKLQLNYSSDVDEEEDNLSSVLSSSSVVSSDSEMNDSESDDDGPPTEEPIKPKQPIRVAPPKREGNPKAKERVMKVCKNFQRNGQCPRGKRCRDQHVVANQRKSLYEQLVEQEKQKTDRLTVEAIIALGKSGFFDAP